MNPEPHGFSSETQDIIEDVIEYLKNGISQEELQLLLSEDQDWERFQVEADLSRDEADILHEALNKLRMDTATEDKDMLQKELLDRDRFLDEFPMVKMELEERISELHALADKVDKTHRDCTISYLVANSVGAFSGVLTILGLALAPVTAGVSLALSATGMGLGTAAAITSVSTSIVDHSNRLSAKASASKLMLTGDHESVVKAVLPSLVPITKNCIQVSSKITKTVHAIKLAKDNPRLVANARRLMTTGNISKRRGKQVQKAFGGTSLAMTKEARVMGMATAGVSLLMDVFKLVQESQHLQEGAKAESAEELREEARELERKLEELTEIYKNLQ
ncbi:apolipoprotein L3-like isoform X2 [Trichechus manatus latirostris]|uniref:Apolipoprotein L3-like isoform X2 n=1 Tax=Trichechus manatus latirostris TaxID=127582 RepID=A0A2Y9QMU1_TRIMA|nr:apolipoprotein L3-like isoform X2 [Trichechus manatus latirostris]